MLALGAIVGALCAHAGLAPIAQIIIAAALGSAFVLACYLVRRRQPSRQPASSNREDRKSTRLNSSHSQISYAVFCLKKKNKHHKLESPLPNLDQPRDSPQQRGWYLLLR